MRNASAAIAEALITRRSGKRDAVRWLPNRKKNIAMPVA